MKKILNYLKIKLFALVILLIFLSQNLLLALDPDEQLSILQQQIIAQQQEQQRQNEENRQQIRETEKLRKSKEKQGLIEPVEKDNNLESSFSEDSKAQNNYRFSEIKLIGNKIYSTKYLNKKILNNYIGEAINKKNIHDIQNEIIKLYIESGYITTRVYFDLEKTKIDMENPNKSLFVIVIEEGKVDKIKLIKKNKKKIQKSEDQKDQKDLKKISKFKQFRLNSQLFFIFPFKKNKLFNIKDFEQGLDQMNRLQSNNVTMEIKPPEIKRVGYSDIIITNNNKSARTTFLNAGVDNSGSESTGEMLANASINQDNLFGINDNLYIKYTENIDGDGDFESDILINPNLEKNKRYSKSFYSSLLVPFGYWSLSASLSYSKYLTTINGYSTTFTSKGNTFVQNYTLDRVIYRKKLYKLNMGTNLEIRDTESYIRDIKSETGSRISTNINLYLSNTIYTKYGTIILKPSYQRGLDWFNSKRDMSDLLDTEPRLQYDLFKFYVYYNTRINLPLFTKTQIKDELGNNLELEVKKQDENGEEIIQKKPLKIRNKIPLNYTLSIDSQYSMDTLYGTNQFSAGGEYTVRGFKESNISGDNGFYIRNDLKVSVKYLIPRFILNTKFMNYGGSKNVSINDAFSRTYFGVFYDYGYVKDKYKDSSDIVYNSQSGHMNGAGISLNYYGKYLSWAIIYAKSLQSPSYLETRDGIKKEKDAIYWRVGLSW
ncbi:MAG: ShlB/FhaC/HecB family hemolysin secretion/activation protein [Elusimicrobiota bacterium]|jgi:hemolysin activation/secretion protein|nr:ShlB/FhaC/HecB family hemolysin secretion/activation protein [Elusimicrobiota bacterium]